MVLTAPTCAQVWYWTSQAACCQALASKVMVGSVLVAGAAWGWFAVWVPSIWPPLIVVPAVALFRMCAELDRLIDDVDEVTLWPARELLLMVTAPSAHTSLVT